MEGQSAEANSILEELEVVIQIISHYEIIYEPGVGGRDKAYEAEDTNLDLSLP
jgi:hypothetical protein